jgi:putative toxin-antitoxin system antitoxin component (TIGR02293 family)
MEALGGWRVLGQRPTTYGAVVASVRAGLPYAALESVARRFDLPQETLVRVLRLPARTLARRKKESRLRPDESDRLLRLGRVASYAEEVLGTREKAGRWLRTPNRALGGAVPLELLDTDLGAQQVEQILGRVEYGVFS